MALTTRTVTHTIFGQGGVELAAAVVTATLSDDEEDVTNKHVRINDTPALTFTADGSGIALLLLPDNVNNSYYTIRTFIAGTTDFVSTLPLHSVKIRVAGSDDDLVDLIVGE